jgi:amino acid adenylation domain-containing protein
MRQAISSTGGIVFRTCEMAKGNTMSASIDERLQDEQSGWGSTREMHGFPLSRAQQGIWIAQNLDPSNPRYNCAGYLKIHGAIDPAILESAVRQAITETEALRVRFVSTGEQVSQCIEAPPAEVLQWIDVSQERDPQASADAFMKNDLAQVVDLTRAPLFKQVLFTCEPQCHIFYLRYHHIVMDGFGQTRYWSRVGDIYSALAAGAECTANPFGTLKEILDEDALYRDSLQFARDRKYWNKAFIERAEPARLSGVATMASPNLLRRIVTLPATMTERLRAVSQRTAKRWSVVALAATAAYLQRMTGIDNVVIGLPVTTRMTPVARETPCMMANELPLRLTVPPAMTLRELLQHVSEQVGRVLMHQRYRGEELHSALKLAGSEEKLTGPVVNVISFDHQVRFGEHDTTPHYLSSGPVTDLLVGFYGKADSSALQIYFDANPELYTSDELLAHEQRFVYFLNTFLLASQDLSVGELTLLLPGEAEQLDSYNATARDYGLSKCLHELIDEQAHRTPDNIAIAVTAGSMSYRQLSEASDRLATHLQSVGVMPGQRVGVCDVRSLELVVELLAIMKAGAAYVPLDPALPPARLEFQIANAEIGLVLSRSTLIDRFAATGVRTLAVDQLLPALPATTLPHAEVTPGSAAYVIYTSGSTGQPKGVAVPQRGVVNRLLWMQEAYRLDSSDCVLQKTPFTFDVSVWEFFWPLITGCRLFLAEPELHRDPRYVATTIREQGITTLHFVPPMLDMFLAEPGLSDLKCLRRVVCSGEALSSETVRAFFEVFDPDQHGAELFNLYGPTEASIDVTAWRCRPADAHARVPIGRPVANTQIYLLDANGARTPVGAAGELYIGGVQVALGYVSQPQLTAERFVKNPFAPGLMYRSGDLARYRKDGAIDFLGRLDHQVKLRGFRIELGEIEATLLIHPTIQQAVVVAWDRNGHGRRLVAYCVPRSTGAPAEHDLAAELLTFLGERLPQYMIPAHIVVMPALPMSSNGKIDRRALPAPILEADGAVALPVTSVEQLLHRTWAQVLGFHRFGVDQSFFSLGGDSMQSIRVRIGMEQHGYTFATRDLFRSPTIRALAAHVHRLGGDAATYTRSEPFDLVRSADRVRLPGGLEDAYPLSTMQAGMLFHAEFDQDSAVYRVVTSLHVAAVFNPLALQKALADTFQRHPALRSSFDLSSYSEPLQLVHPHVEIPFEVAGDLGEYTAAEAQRVIDAWVGQAKFHYFDVSKAPLLRFTVHLRGAQSFQLSVVEHHVVLDGWSDAAMLAEIVRRYRAELSGEALQMPAIASSYRDFVAEERRALGDIAARDFWQQTLRGAEPTLLPRKATQQSARASTQQQSFPVQLAPGIREQLRHLARSEGLPLKSLLAAAHVLVMRLVCSASDVVTGVVANGRLEELGGDEVIGVFLNTLPIRLDTPSGSLISLAHKVFAHERDSAPYRRYPFAQIQRDLGGQLQLDSYFNFMDFHLGWQPSHGKDPVILGSSGVAETNIPLAANFLMDPVEIDLRVWLDCDLALLEAGFCQRLVGYYQRALQAMAGRPQSDIAALDLIGTAEWQTISAWNDTAYAYDDQTSLHEQISLQAARTPMAPALVHRWQTLSYAQLDGRANQLARQLRLLGVKRGSLVGVCLHRSAELVVSLLAVMKAGGAYVPLDPSFPQQRLAFIVGDAHIDCLLTDSKGPADLGVGKVLLIDRDAASIAAHTSDALARDPVLDAGGADPVYVIYTSGSSGSPKGTVIRHHNVINFFVGMDARIGCTAADAVLAVTSISFDISVLELLWPLTLGAKVVVASEHMILNLVRNEDTATLDHDDSADAEHVFADLCTRHQITLMQGTPSFLAAVAAESRALSSLKHARAVLVGGEAFPAGLAERMLAVLPSTRIFNMYGPTETTIWSTVHELERSDTKVSVIPIGIPIVNTEVSVLDAAGVPVPIGVAGELWIGGAGVAGLYLGRPELTAQRFPLHSSGKGRIYRTGDRVRWRSDGVLEFLGRVDRQVKILGHRVEPDEVESVLSTHPQVAAVAVVAHQKESSTQLVAFVAPTSSLLDGAAEASHVRRWGEIWDDAYRDASGDDSGEFAGWLSSYDNAAIPVAQMREWLAHTVKRIDGLQPRHMLDVGVGTGLFLREFAPRVERYTGIDVSAAALANAAASLGSSLPAHVTLIHGDANFLQSARGTTDTVILNSVIQYFPGTQYLERVLREAARVVGSSGAVFVGDVRDVALLEAFHATVQLKRAPALMPGRDIAAVLARQCAAESELCVSPDFFRQFAAHLDTLGEPRLEIKRGHAENELSCFRFDAVLLGRERADRVRPATALQWDDIAAPGAAIGVRAAMATLEAVLSGHPDGVTVSGIRNQRLVRPLKLVQLLREADAKTTAWDLEKALWEYDDGGAVDPELIAVMAESHGYRVRLLIPAHGQLDRFDAVLERED